MSKLNAQKTHLPSMSFLYYVIFLLMGLFLQIRLGLYAYDLIVFIFVGVSLLMHMQINRGIGQYLSLLWLFVLLPALSSLVYQLFVGEELSGMSFYLIYNVLVLTCYIIFIGATFRYTELNYNIILLLISIPIFSSLSMYAIPGAFQFLQGLYSVTDRPDRFGGIFGRDANQLGYYSTLLIILSSFLKVRKRIGVVFYLVVLSSLFAILVSGMRSGILLFVVLGVPLALTTHKKIIGIKELAGLGLIIALCLVLFAGTFQGEIEYFKERFSLDLLYNQTVGRSENHIGAMYKKWFSIMLQNESIFSSIFSLIPSWKFPDSFIIFLLANGGLLGFFGFGLFALFNGSVILRSKVGSKPILMFVLLFNLLICIKGNFMCNNVGMFLFVFIVMMILNEPSHSDVTACSRTQRAGLNAHM